MNHKQFTAPRPAAALALLAIPLFLAPPVGAQPTDSIVIGQTIAQTGSTAEHGLAVLQGARLYIDQVNARGGIGGARIQLLTLDDGGSAARAAENTRNLIAQNKAVAIFGGIEGGPCTASMEVAEAARVPLIGCMAGAHAFRQTYRRYVFPVRAGHLREFEQLIDNARQFGLKRIGFLHTDSENGREHLANVNKLLAERGLEAAIPLSIPGGAGKPDPAELVKQIEARKVEAMFNHGSYALYADVIRLARQRQLSTQFMAVNSGAQQMVGLLGKEAEGLIFTQVVPYPWGSTPPVVKEYRDAFAAAHPQEPFSFSSLEGYISAKLLVEGLRRAGPALSRERLVDSLEQMGEVDLGGFTVSYDRTRHEGARFVDTVIALKDGRFRH